MKKILGIILFVAVVWALGACSGGGEKQVDMTPSDVAEGFVKAMQEQDVIKAASYFDTKGVDLDVLPEPVKSRLTDGISNAFSEMTGAAGEMKSYEILSEEISADGNSAVVKVRLVFDVAPVEMPLKLAKDDNGAWKVEM